MNFLAKLCTFLLAGAVAMYAIPSVEAAINCEALGGFEECMRPADSVNATGQFICRRRWQNGVGVRPRVDYQTLCIAKTWGRDSDRCGCCNGNCPNTCGEVCPNPQGGVAGQLGVWIYDWYSFQPKRMCISPGRSLQLQQQNGQRWKCMEDSSWFWKVLGGGFRN